MSEVMDPSTLSVLSARELQRLISGEGAGSGADAEWEYGKIMASVVCRHGYTVESSQVCAQDLHLFYYFYFLLLFLLKLPCMDFFFVFLLFCLLICVSSGTAAG